MRKPTRLILSIENSNFSFISETYSEGSHATKFSTSVVRRAWSINSNEFSPALNSQEVRSSDRSQELGDGESNHPVHAAHDSDSAVVAHGQTELLVGAEECHALC